MGELKTVLGAAGVKNTWSRVTGAATDDSATVKGQEKIAGRSRSAVDHCVGGRSDGFTVADLSACKECKRN